MPKRQTLEQIETSLKRWHSKLKRAVTAIDKLEKAKRRAARADVESVIKNAPPPPRPEPEAAPAATPAPAPAPLPPTEDLGIPSFLMRAGPIGSKTPADLEAIKAIEEEQEARKKAKTSGRIAKLKADKAGERKAMPLTGKAALARIKEAV